MKKVIYLLILLDVAIAEAQIFPPEHEWTATVKVVDDAGQPVVGAKVRVSYSVYVKDPVSGSTDTNGVFIATHRDATEHLGINVEKPGYYPSALTYYKGEFKPNRWNPTITLLLKKKNKPISMYAKAVRAHVPDLDKPVGYDLTIGDWTAPYGRGVQSDFLFTAHFETNKSESDFTLTVSFPNSGDGIQEFTSTIYAQEGPYSELKSSQEAPTDGYQPDWVQTDNRSAGKPIRTNQDPHHNYYFRVRTKVDNKGNIINAHYGKIYGEFMTFSYYYNPAPNDRNMEFDPAKNLIKNLKPLEEVKEP